MLFRVTDQGRTEIPEQTHIEIDTDKVELLLLSIGDFPGLVIEYLSSKLFLTSAEAKQLTSAGSGVIAKKMPLKKANAEIALLAAIGANAKVLDISDGTPKSLFDISVRWDGCSPTDKLPIKKIRRKLKGIGLPHKVHAVDFCGPAGWELCALSYKRASKYVKLLRNIGGVTVALCSQEVAIFDVMSPQGLTREEKAEVRDFVKVLRCSFSGHGVLASGLRRDQLAELTAKFPNARLVGVNRAFSRLNFYVTGDGTMAVEKLPKFGARYGLAAIKALAKGERHRTETNLPRSEARLAFEWLASMGVEFEAEWFLPSCSVPAPA